MAKSKLQVLGMEKVKAMLEGASLKGQKTGKVSVGFSAPYAIYVHEDLTKTHHVGTAKFLEKALKASIAAVRRIFMDALNNKKSLNDALLKAGEEVKREAVNRTPIDTGFLRNSAYVQLEP